MQECLYTYWPSTFITDLLRVAANTLYSTAVQMAIPSVDPRVRRHVHWFSVLHGDRKTAGNKSNLLQWDYHLVTEVFTLPARGLFYKLTLAPQTNYFLVGRVTAM